VFKLLFMLLVFLGVGMALLGLRQRRLELQSDSVTIYDHIRERQEALLDQRAQIARETNPLTLAALLQHKGVNTGAALQLKDTSLGKGSEAQPVETDLVAPVMGQ